MEGLGTAVELTVKIASLCAEYSSAVKNASHDIQSLRERISSLETTLKDVMELLESSHGARLRTSQKLHDALNNSRLLLDSIATTLENKLNGGRKQRTMRAFGLRALKWPFESKKLENIMAGLEQHQNTMVVAMQIDQTAEVLTINHKIDLSKLPVAKGAAFNSQANEYVPRCHPRTRLNVLAGIYNWFEDPHGKCIYWLCGMAGTGKSTISRTVAEYLTEKNIPCASFFFKKGEVPHVRAAIEADMNISDKTKSEQFEKLILEPLDKCEDQQSTIVSIVIDALDECDLEEDVRLMVLLLARAMDVTSVRLRFFITSRPELPIRLGFKSIGDSYKELALHEIPKPDIKNDIAVYLEDQLKAIVQHYNMSVETRRQLPSQWPGSKDTERLVDMAIPLFIYAATACRFISDRRLGGPKEQLEIFFNSHRNPKSNLDATYLPVLEQLTRDLKGGEKRAVITKFKEIVDNLRKDICDLRRPGTLRLDIEQETIDIRFPPEIQYACLYWVHHLKESGVIVRDHDQVYDFLIRHLLHWIEALSLIGRISESSGMLDNLLGTIDSEDGVETSAIIRDIKRIILINRWSIDEAPLQIYSSALLFAPEQIESNWDACLATLEGHNDWTRAVSFSPDGRQLASAASGGTIKLWDPATGRCTATLVSGGISAVCFSPDSQRLASAEMKQIKLWNAITGRCIITLDGHYTRITDISFAPDGRRLASASHDRTVKLWDTETGDCIRTFVGHNGFLEGVSFAPDNRRLASVANKESISNGYVESYDHNIKLWDTVAGSRIIEFTGHEDRINTIRFTPDGRWLASASDDSTIKLWDTAIGSCIATLVGHDEGINAICFTPDSRWLASASHDRTVKLWDIETGLCTATFKGHSQSVTAVNFAPDNWQLASASHDSTIKLWDTTISRSPSTTDIHSHKVTAISFTPDGRQLASASDDHTVKLWDTATGRCITTFKGHSQSVTAVTFAPDGRQLASASEYDKTIKLWDITTGHCVATLQTDGYISQITFAPNSQQLASVSGYITKLWDITTGRCTAELDCNRESILSIAFSPNSQELVSTLSDHTIKLWDLSTGNCTATLPSEERVYGISAITVSPNGQLLASAYGDYTVKIWDMTTHDCIMKLEGHSFWVSAMTFAPNGQLVSASGDDTIKFWDIATGICTATLKGYGSWVGAINFTMDGSIACDLIGTGLSIGQPRWSRSYGYHQLIGRECQL
ncbi:WD domain, g-beta repeat domain-containing protein [Trichoderma breve]|uniref:WD domain, g-beta repeat domain-containing protein n=1 Tax=Trichoderma breve TaxID=2034170 RepID=A0A9W9B437_9HYPO|nr:WD domain, g-beta repeat domain-containing protein [Trichoderma breve]KAJ4855762.1 WD domain, g-beta repeat domain-containing protein [Trichoderma breve]